MKIWKFGSALLLAGVLSSAGYAATLTTGFNANNGYKGNMFDVLIGDEDLTVETLSLNVSHFSDVTVAAYVKSGSYVGSETDSSAWTLLDSAIITANGRNTASLWDIDDFTLSANESYGLYLTILGAGTMNYRNGTSLGALAASNADLSIFQGVGKGPDFGATFRPRVWQGSITYSTAPSVVPVPASLPFLLLGALGLGVMGMRRKL